MIHIGVRVATSIMSYQAWRETVRHAMTLREFVIFLCDCVVILLDPIARPFRGR